MAQLAPNSDWLMQQIGGQVVILHRYSEEELLAFDPVQQNETALAQGKISNLDRLTKEEKAFAHFWSGYFHAHARGV